MLPPHPEIIPPPTDPKNNLAIAGRIVLQYAAANSIDLCNERRKSWDTKSRKTQWYSLMVKISAIGKRAVVILPVGRLLMEL
jgi:hypothetical protein